MKETASNLHNSYNRPATSLAEETHYTLTELSKLWGFSRSVLQPYFANEPGVLKLNRPETRRKRGYLSLRVPASVADRVHRRLHAA